MSTNKRSAAAQRKAGFGNTWESARQIEMFDDIGYEEDEIMDIENGLHHQVWDDDEEIEEEDIVGD